MVKKDGPYSSRQLQWNLSLINGSFSMGEGVFNEGITEFAAGSNFINSFFSILIRLRITITIQKPREHGNT